MKKLQYVKVLVRKVPVEAFTESSFSSVQFSSVHILKFLYIQYLNKTLITYNDYE